MDKSIKTYSNYRITYQYSIWIVRIQQKLYFKKFKTELLIYNNLYHLQKIVLIVFDNHRKKEWELNTKIFKILWFCESYKIFDNSIFQNFFYRFFITFKKEANWFVFSDLTNIGNGHDTHFSKKYQYFGKFLRKA